MGWHLRNICSTFGKKLDAKPLSNKSRWNVVGCTDNVKSKRGKLCYKCAENKRRPSDRNTCRECGDIFCRGSHFCFHSQKKGKHVDNIKNVIRAELKFHPFYCSPPYRWWLRRHFLIHITIQRHFCLLLSVKMPSICDKTATSAAKNWFFYLFAVFFCVFFFFCDGQIINVAVNGGFLETFSNPYDPSGGS